MDGIPRGGLRLSDLSPPLKTVISLFLVMMGLAYMNARQLSRGPVTRVAGGV